MLKNLNIQEFTRTLSSDAPVPGGGSVAALSSAIGCSLVAMVGNLTVGKKKYEEVSEEAGKIAASYEKLSDEFLDLIDEDAQVFDKVMDAYGMPKASDEEKAARTEAIQSSLKEAALVPLKVAKKSAELFDSCEFLVKNGNKNAKSDVLVAAMMLRTGVLAALMNVDINLGSIKDEAFVKETAAEADKLRELAIRREQEILSN